MSHKKDARLNIYLTDRSKAVLLLCILCVFSVLCLLCAFVHVCLYVPCGHLLGKGCLLGSCLWCLTVSLSLSHWYPGSGVVLDCIDSWSLHPYLHKSIEMPTALNTIFAINLWLFFLFISFNMCFGCSKELSHWEFLLSIHSIICFGWLIRKLNSWLHTLF